MSREEFDKFATAHKKMFETISHLDKETGELEAESFFWIDDIKIRTRGPV